MHYYFFDSRATKNDKSGQLSRIQSWIKTSRIAGQQLELRSPQHIIEEVKKLTANPSVSAIVVAGDDLSLDLAISSLQNNDKEIPLGYIPLLPNSLSAKLLNITDWKQATAALLRGKRESFKLLGVEDYVVLSGCMLSPKATTLDSSSTTTLKLDKQLTLDLPSAELALTNITNDPAMAEHKQPIMIEAISSASPEERLQNKKPLISLPVRLREPAKPKILRLKANTISIKTTTPLLLQNLIQLRPVIEVTEMAGKQALIVNRKRDVLS